MVRNIHLKATHTPPTAPLHVAGTVERQWRYVKLQRVGGSLRGEEGVITTTMYLHVCIIFPPLHARVATHLSPTLMEGLFSSPARLFVKTDEVGAVSKCWLYTTRLQAHV